MPGGSGAMADEPSPPTPTEPAVVGELRALAQRAQAGDAAALPRLREVLDGHPEVWRHVGDLAAVAERAWVDVLAGTNPLAAESLGRSAAEMKAELLGERPGRLERLLADQVAATWLEVNYFQATAANPGPGSLEQAALALRRLESAHRRHLGAIKALADVRRLAPAGRAPARDVQLHEPRRQRA